MSSVKIFLGGLAAFLGGMVILIAFASSMDVWWQLLLVIIIGFVSIFAGVKIAFD